MSLFIKIFSLYNPIKFLAILYPKSLANLVVEVETRQSHQILFDLTCFAKGSFAMFRGTVIGQMQESFWLWAHPMRDDVTM